MACKLAEGLPSFLLMAGRSAQDKSPIALWLSIVVRYLTVRINTIKQENRGKAYQHPRHHEINGQHSISALKENEGGLHVERR